MTQIVILSLILLHFTLITLRVVVDKNCAHMCYFLELNGNSLPKLQDNQFVRPKTLLYLYIRQL